MGDQPVSLAEGNELPRTKLQPLPFSISINPLKLSQKQKINSVNPDIPVTSRNLSNISLLSRLDPIKKGNTIGQTRSEAREIQPDVLKPLSSIPTLRSESTRPGFAESKLKESMDKRLTPVSSPESGETIVGANPQGSPQAIVTEKDITPQDKFYKTKENFRRDMYEYLLNQVNKRTLEQKNPVYGDNIVTQPMTLDPLKQEQQLANQNINTTTPSADLQANLIGATAQQANVNDFRQKVFDNIQGALAQSYQNQINQINQNNQARTKFENDMIQQENLAAQAQFEEDRMNDAERVKLMVDQAFGNEFDNAINDENAKNQAAMEIQQYTQEFVNEKLKNDALKLEEANKNKSAIVQQYQQALSKATTDEQKTAVYNQFKPLVEDADKKYAEVNQKYLEAKKKWETSAQLLFAQAMQQRQMELRGPRPGETIGPVTSAKDEYQGILQQMGMKTYKKGGMTLEEKKDLESHKSKLKLLEKKDKKELTVQDKVYLQERKATLEREKSRHDNSLKRINSLLNRLANIK